MKALNDDEDDELACVKRGESEADRMSGRLTKWIGRSVPCDEVATCDDRCVTLIHLVVLEVSGDERFEIPPGWRRCHKEKHPSEENHRRCQFAAKPWQLCR